MKEMTDFKPGTVEEDPEGSGVEVLVAVSAPCRSKVAEVQRGPVLTGGIAIGEAKSPVSVVAPELVMVGQTSDVVGVGGVDIPSTVTYIDIGLEQRC